MILNEILTQTSSFLSHDNDDFVDRLHYRYTIISLAVYLVLLGTKQYYGDPIVCHLPSSAAESKNYILSACWVNGTHRFNKSIPLVERKFDDSTRITYYQWITFIIIGQCFLFVIPSLLWSFINHLNGFDIVHATRNVLRKAYLGYYSRDTNWSHIQDVLQNTTDQLRLSVLKIKNRNIRNGIVNDKKKDDDNENLLLKQFKHKLTSKRNAEPNLKAKSSFPLFIPYLVVKLICLINVILQFLILGWAFGFNYLNYGFEEFVRLMKRIPYNFDNKYFPKRSMCEVTLFTMGHENNHTFICSLPINLFNEIFYSGFWLWLLVLFVLTLCSFFYWASLLINNYRRKVVLKLLDIDLENDDHSPDRTLTMNENFNLFFQHVCSLDLILIVKLLAINTHSIVGKDLLTVLWREYFGLNDALVPEEKKVRRPVPPMLKPNFDLKSVDETQVADE